MATYLFRFSYTPESWAALIEHPEDRREMLATRVFGFGGQLQGFWYSFGEHDGYALVELPDNVSAAAVLAAVSADRLAAPPRGDRARSRSRTCSMRSAARRSSATSSPGRCRRPRPRRRKG